MQEKEKQNLPSAILSPLTKKQMEAMMKSGMKEGWNSSLDKLKKVLEMK